MTTAEANRALLHEELTTAYTEVLDEREKLVLAMCYYENMTQEQIGKVLGLSQGRIMQIHQAALAKLRRKLA